MRAGTKLGWLPATPVGRQAPSIWSACGRSLLLVEQGGPEWGVGHIGSQKENIKVKLLNQFETGIP